MIPHILMRHGNVIVAKANWIHNCICSSVKITKLNICKKNLISDKDLTQLIREALEIKKSISII